MGLREDLLCSIGADAQLGSRVREILEEGGDVDERKMFGGLAFMVNGHMCCGVIGVRSL